MQFLDWKKMTVFLDWNYTFLHVSGHSARPDNFPATFSRVYGGKVLTEIPMANPNEDAPGLETTSTGIRKGRAVNFKHLKHPELNESLKSHQQVTFRLVKSGKRKLLIEQVVRNPLDWVIKKFKNSQKLIPGIHFQRLYITLRKLGPILSLYIFSK